MGINGGWTPRHLLVSFSLTFSYSRFHTGRFSRGLVYTSLDICVKAHSVFLFAVCCSEGGLFKAHLYFPKEYPQRPPKMRFISDFWHPNGKFVTTWHDFVNACTFPQHVVFFSLFCVAMTFLC